MPSLHLSLTDELRAFVDQNSGNGTPFATPSEFVRALIREKKERQEAAAMRHAVLDGLDDVLHARTTRFSGDLRAMLQTHRRHHPNGSQASI